MLLRRLRVLLNEVSVGTLSLDEPMRAVFRASPAYLAMHPRPVLGQLFVDDPQAEHEARTRLPPWFANLLPEGALRELLVRQLGASATNEFLLLQSLADDLPGAVRLETDVDDPKLSDAALAARTGQRAITAGLSAADLADDGTSQSLRFSLAGVQLKFSALGGDRGLTVPMSGRGGDWIVKLPDQRFAGVPRIEAATMQWARAAGVEVPLTRLEALADIVGLPAGLGPWHEQQALAVRRFDRAHAGLRVHMEDFAQVLGVFPERKYEQANFETLGRLVLAIVGPGGLDEWLRRIVFMLASGNGDAHLKNWSLIYPDGITARLSPAYDLVSTVLFMPMDRLALNLGRSKDWTAMDSAVFERLGRKLGQAPAPWMAAVNQAVRDTLDAWQRDASEFGYSADERQRLLAHIRRVPLLAPYWVGARG